MVATSQAGTLSVTRLHVEGMDCPSCASKIEKALLRQAGVAEVNVSYASESVVVTHHEVSAPLGSLIARLKMLGYPSEVRAAAGAEPKRPDAPESDHVHSQDREHHHEHDEDHGTDHQHSHGAAGFSWRDPRTKIVTAVGLLLVGGFAVSLVTGRFGEWVYLPAAVVGLLYFGRRAAEMAYAGFPFSIETLMVVAGLGAIGIGSVSEASVVVFLFGIGEMLEGVAASRARAGIASLAALMPKTALVEAGGTTKEVPASELAIDQIILVRPGDRVSADGVIVEGQSHLDQSPVTGESTPVEKQVGDDVFAGSINASGQLRVKVTRAASDNTIARIVDLVEKAQEAKSPTARFIDRFSAWYTPAAMIVAALTIVVPPLLFHAEWSTWIYRGLSLLLIACPCALILSTPAAIASGLAAGARRGLLVKGGAALETIAKIRTIAFDKTGTLTAGRPQVTDIVPFGVSEMDLVAAVASVETGSSHPIALSILKHAEAESIKPPMSTKASALPGKGVWAVVDGTQVAVISARYARETGVLDSEASARAEALEEEGKTVVIATRNGRTFGIIALRDEARPDAAPALAALRKLGLRTLMLTGDNRKTGAAVAGSLGLDVMSELMPEQKLAEISSLRSSGGVAMVGDGINDAPALAAADVGIAMGGGTDVALETADAALLKDRVTGIVEFVLLARATMSNIHWNIAIALGLKVIFLATTLFGITSLWMAILADTGATVLVTLNALRLLRFRPDLGVAS